jgi:hypothetical protein
MSKNRMVLLSLLALPVLSAVTSSSASAACESKTAVWCVGGKAFEGKETYTSTGGVFKLETTIAKTTVALECKEETGEGTIEKGGDGVNINRYGGKCSVVGSPKCAVAEPIDIGPLETELRSVAGKFYNTFKVKTEGEALGKIELKNNGEEVCLLKGKYEVKGEGCSEVGPEAVKFVWKFSKAAEEACKTELKFSAAKGEKGEKAVLTGESTQILTGENKGKEWGAG